VGPNPTGGTANSKSNGRNVARQCPARQASPATGTIIPSTRAGGQHTKLARCAGTSSVEKSPKTTLQQGGEARELYARLLCAESLVELSTHSV